MHDLWLFALATLALLGTPGPTNTLLATAGALRGIGPALPLLAAELAGYLTTITLLMLVLGPVLVALPWVASLVKLAVAAYVGWAAVRLWRSGGGVGDTGKVAVPFRQVLVTTLLNPKGLVFAFSVFPPPSAAIWQHYVLFSLLVPAVGLGWILVGRGIGAVAGRSRARLVQRSAAVVLAGFAGLLVVSTIA